MVTLSMLAAAFVITPATLQLCADVKDALRLAGITTEQAAERIRAPRSKLSEQLWGHAPFTLFWRFAELPEVWSHFWLIQARRCGAVVIESASLANYIEQSAAAIEKLARVELAMAKMSLVDPQSQEKSA